MGCSLAAAWRLAARNSRGDHVRRMGLGDDGLSSPLWISRYQDQRQSMSGCYSAAASRPAFRRRQAITSSVDMMSPNVR
jgi:hypothetical protein